MYFISSQLNFDSKRFHSVLWKQSDSHRTVLLCIILFYSYLLYSDQPILFHSVLFQNQTSIAFCSKRRHATRSLFYSIESVAFYSHDLQEIILFHLLICERSRQFGEHANQALLRPVTSSDFFLMTPHRTPANILQSANQHRRRCETCHHVDANAAHLRDRVLITNALNQYRSFFLFAGRHFSIGVIRLVGNQVILQLTSPFRSIDGFLLLSQP